VRFFEAIFGLTARLITILIFLLVVALLAGAAVLDDAASGAIKLALLPVKLIDWLITLSGQIDFGALFKK
jgi:hypothetical protein